MIIASKLHPDGSVVELEVADADEWPSAALCRRLADERRLAQQRSEALTEQRRRVRR